MNNKIKNLQTTLVNIINYFNYDGQVVTVNQLQFVAFQILVNAKMNKRPMGLGVLLDR